MHHSDPEGRCASNHSRLVNTRVPIRGAVVGPESPARRAAKPRRRTPPAAVGGRDDGAPPPDWQGRGEGRRWEIGRVGDQATRTKPIGVS